MKKNICVGFISLILLFVSTTKSGASEYNIPSRSEIESVANKVANWQLDNFSFSTVNRHDYGISSWTHSVFYLGLFEWAKIRDEGNTYSDWLYDYVGGNSNWMLNGIYPYHADEFCAGQFFSLMYEKYKQENILANTLARVENVMNSSLNESMSYRNKQRWTWCDALFMAPSLYARLSSQKNDDKYVRFMDVEFKKTYNHLFDKSEYLFYRDDSYFDKTEANGNKVFWGRGNGWALAGVANILKELPESSEYRNYYTDIFRELALSLINLQDENGAWHASLLDPESYPAAETSATALITYALVYGLNNGLLTSGEAYIPVLKAWNKLCDAVQESGKLGWVQPIGQDPKTISKDMTATFGVGAFLMTAAEMHRMSGTTLGLINNSNFENCFNDPSTRIILFTIDGKKISEESLGNRTIHTFLNQINKPAGIYLIHCRQKGETVVFRHFKK